MTLSEFKAWFEGFTDGIDGAPTEKQFAKIKAKVGEITGTPITQTVYIEKYRDAWHRPYGWPYVSYSVGSASLQNGVGTASLTGMMQSAGAAPEADRYKAAFANQTVEWDSHAAMFAAGKADAETLAA